MKVLVSIYSNQAGFKMADKIFEFSDVDVQVMGINDLIRIAKEKMINDTFMIDVEILSGEIKNEK